MLSTTFKTSLFSPVIIKRIKCTGNRCSSTTTISTTGTPVIVKAYYIARRIDILKAHSGVYSSLKRSRLEQKSVTIEIDRASNQYVSVFTFGSVVLFNIPSFQHEEHLKRIQESSVVTPLTNEQKTNHVDNYRIMINPHLDKPSVIKAEHVNIRSLDNNNIAIISTVIAQSVALDYYAESVNTMLDTFMIVNLNIEKTGNFQDLKAQGLYQLVAVNNRVFVTVLSRLGIFEGSEAAWDNNDYHGTFEALRKDFEIELRYKDLSLKLDIIKDNSKFFLEILHNQKSTKMEVAIIVLIAAEIVIGICGLLQ